MAPYQWTSSQPSRATVNSSGLVTGILSGQPVTITLTDAQTNSTTLIIHIVKPGISPGALTTCVGVANTFVLTNSAGTGAVMWSESGTLTGNGRTNVLAFDSAGVKTLTATYAGCSATSAVVVVGVASLTANATNFCGGGTVIYTAASTPAGYESQLSWGGETLSGGGAKRTNTYSTIGPHVVSVSCGTSVKYATNIVYRMDIAQASATLLADATTPVTLNLTNSYGTPIWQLMPSGGAAIGGSGSTITITPGSVGTNYILTACASEQPSCCDTAAVQVVKVNFNTNLVVFCEGTNATIKISIAPTNAPALTFDTVTNVATGTANTVATVSVSNGTNMTITPVSPGTATLRVRLGNSTSFGPVIKVVRVTFPTNAWYVGVGQTTSFATYVLPSDAPVSYTSKEPGIASASGNGTNVSVTGITPGTTKVVSVAGGQGCSDKTVEVIQVTMFPSELNLCVGQVGTITTFVSPANAPVTFVSDSTNDLSVTRSGNVLSVVRLTTGSTFVRAQIDGTTIASAQVRGLSTGTASGINQQWLSKPPQENVAGGYRFTTPSSGAIPGKVKISAADLNTRYPKRGTTAGSGFLASFQLRARFAGVSAITPMPDQGNALYNRSHQPVGLTQFEATTVQVRDPADVPEVILTSPEDGSLFSGGSKVDLTATATPTIAPISKVEFFANGTNKIGESLSEPYAVTWTNAPDGDHSLIATATDTEGGVGVSAAVHITVNGPPGVTITSPANGAIFSAPASIPINVTATDSDGSVTQVLFYAGASLLGLDTTSPYAFTWSNVSTGSYSLTARAVDNRGATNISAAIAI